MKHRLYIVEGLPCSGKSTTAAYVASLLEGAGSVCLVDEGTGEHPADYENHALAPAGLLGEQEQIVRLSDYSGELLEKLLPYKIYDGLPWERELPLMLDKWRAFAEHCEEDRIYVFNCVLLQNPLCETMMRFDFPEETTEAYIRKIVEIIRPLEPVVLYLKNTEIAASVTRAAPERPGWLEAVIDYHCGGAYGRRIGARGLEGYLRCLEDRQTRELGILSRLPVSRLVLEDPQRDWKAAKAAIRTFLADLNT